MKTIKESYPYASIGQGGINLMGRCWGGFYYLVPLADAAEIIGMDRATLSRKCCNRELIARKIAGMWFVAYKSAVILHSDCNKAAELSDNIALSN